jgi:hypothetical protein
MNVAASAAAAAADDEDDDTTDTKSKFSKKRKPPSTKPAAPTPAPLSASASASRPFKRVKLTAAGAAAAASAEPQKVCFNAVAFESILTLTAPFAFAQTESDKPYLDHVFRYDPLSPDAIVLNKSTSLKPHASVLSEVSACTTLIALVECLKAVL